MAVVLREVRKLRTLDFEICTASINCPARSYVDLSTEERREILQTFYVKGSSLTRALRTHIQIFLKSPSSYLRGLAFAFKIGLRRGLLYPLLYFTEALLVGSWMKSQDLAHLHVHLANAAASVALIVRQVFDTDVSMTVHGPDEFYDVDGQLLRQKIADSAFLICISQFTRSQLMSISAPHDWCKLELVRCGVDCAQFQPLPRRSRSSCFELLCVARLVPIKGHLVLLAALSNLARKGKNFQLRLVGDGPLREQLRRKAEHLGLGPLILFEGNVPQSRVRTLCETADAFVLPSFAEGVPIALMEAMAMELPCIATFVGGIPELIRHEVDGILVMPSDKQGLALSIERLISDPELCRRLGASGRSRIIEHYNLDRNVECLASVFTSRLEHAGKVSKSSCDAAGIADSEIDGD